MALDSGMRPGELFALQWTDIDFDRRRVSLRKSLAPNELGKLHVKDVKT
jgi:integrase